MDYSSDEEGCCWSFGLAWLWTSTVARFALLTVCRMLLMRLMNGASSGDSSVAPGRDWEAAYARDDTPWDKGYASPPLNLFLQRHFVSGEVLVPGCGAGHDVRLLAKGGARVVGLDIAPGALKRARSFPRAGSEEYALGSILEPPASWTERFDWVVEHTCLCALHPSHWERYAASVWELLKPGGHFLAVFYRKVSRDDGQGPPFPISLDESGRLFGHLSGKWLAVESFIPRESYPSRPYGAEEVCLMRKVKPQPGGL
jgi:methyl halide transferase